MSSTLHEMQSTFVVSDENSDVAIGVCDDCGGWIVHEFGHPKPSTYPSVNLVESSLIYCSCNCYLKEI